MKYSKNSRNHCSISGGDGTSCSGPGEVHEYAVNDLEFSLEGPLFAGPNGHKTEIVIDLADVVGRPYEEGMRISDARLKTATCIP